MTRRLNASQVRSAFAEAVSRASFAGERTVIRRHGKEVVAVVSVEDLKTLEALEDRLDLKEARKIMKKPGRLVPWEKVKMAMGPRHLMVVGRKQKRTRTRTRPKQVD